MHNNFSLICNYCNFKNTFFFANQDREKLKSLYLLDLLIFFNNDAYSHSEIVLYEHINTTKLSVKA
jgi:hypothetical protein